MTEILPGLSHLSGKASVFVRGFVEHLADQPQFTAKLRKAQDAGVRNVTELGETISIPYESKLTKLLESYAVITKTRKGKGYEVTWATRFPELIKFLEGSEWGKSIEREDSVETISVRSQFLDHMSQEGIVRISSDSPLPKAAYQVAIDKFKAGDYDMVFVKKNLDLSVLDYGDAYDFNLTMNTDHVFTASVGE